MENNRITYGPFSLLIQTSRMGLKCKEVPELACQLFGFFRNLCKWDSKKTEWFSEGKYMQKITSCLKFLRSAMPIVCRHWQCPIWSRRLLVSTCTKTGIARKKSPCMSLPWKCWISAHTFCSALDLRWIKRLLEASAAKKGKHLTRNLPFSWTIKFSLKFWGKPVPTLY